MKLVILDRDGVINRDSAQFIKTPDEWHPIAGSLPAIARLNHAGYRVVLATNQSGIGRGLLDMASFTAINDKMARALALVGGRIDAVFFCPHAQDSDCACRKPRPGMLMEIGHRFNVALDGVPMIGDALRDLQAAAAVGARPVLVRTGKGARTLADGDLPEGTAVFADLAAAVDDILRDE